MKRLLPLLLLVVAVPLLSAEPAYNPTSAERARWTMSDMRSLVITLNAYKQDHGVYPTASSVEELMPLVQPIYIRVAPLHDAWGTPFRVSSTPEGFRLVSAGADGTFDEASWSTASGSLQSYADDAVATSAGGIRLFRQWEYR
jgi:hypothetical protein